MSTWWKSGFGHKLLSSAGWREGDGLGKRLNGTAEPVKASLKLGTAGLGHDPAKEFTDHWWNAAFDAAASKITVTDNEDGSVAVAKRKKTTAADREKKRKSLYSGFVSSAVLTNGETRDHDNEAEDDAVEEGKKIAPPVVVHLTDEELFKACGGRTAHKGARHGHRMSAKEARLKAMEEKALLQLSSGDKNNGDEAASKASEDRKEKKRKSADEDQAGDLEENVDAKKKKSKKNKRVESEEDHSNGSEASEDQPGEEQSDSGNAVEKKGKDKKRKNKRVESEEEHTNSSKASEDQPMEEQSSSTNSSETKEKGRKKKRKAPEDTEAGSDDAEMKKRKSTDEDEDSNKGTEKKKKKKSKKSSVLP